MKKPLLLVFVTGVILTQMYQNCSQSGFATLDSSSTSPSMGPNDLNHPADKVATPPTQRLQMVNRTYVATLLREVFTSTTQPVPNLEALLNQWVINKGAQYGQGCDPYSSYSGHDCGGSIINANLPYESEDNTVRQSFNVQFCENTLAMDQAVNAVLEKIPNHALAPNSAAIGQIYEMFYRGDDAPVVVINSLLDMDKGLAANNESVMNRWRAVIMQICESPNWQLQ